MNSIALTVYFEEPFYVGVLERRLGDQLSVARMVSGRNPATRRCTPGRAQVGRARHSPLRFQTNALPFWPPIQNADSAR